MDFTVDSILVKSVIKFLMKPAKEIHGEIHNEIHNEICSKSIMKYVLYEIHLKSPKCQLKYAGFHEIHRILQDFMKSMAFPRMLLN